MYFLKISLCIYGYILFFFLRHDSGSNYYGGISKKNQFEHLSSNRIGLLLCGNEYVRF